MLIVHLSAMFLAFTATASATTTKTLAATSGCTVGSTVVFASATNGIYVTADTTQTNTPLLAEQANPQAWEEYKIVDAGNGWVGLKALSNGLYVSADLNNGDALEAGWATTIQSWEMFQLSALSNGYYSLQSYASGYYVSANPDDAKTPLMAQWATTAQEWEEFVCTPVGQAPAGTQRQEMLQFINNISGSKTMAGQHNRESDEGNFIQAMDNITGDYPALWGGDFLYESDQIANRQNMINYEIQGGQKGAAIDLMYHACPPTQAESCDWDGGVLSTLTDAQWSDLVTDGGTLNGVWKSRLDNIAPYFQQIQSAGLPVIFRPMHEMNQSAFWWGGRPGSTGTAKLFQVTRDYLTNHWGLFNIVWVWSMQDIWDSSTGSYDFSEYDPGSVAVIPMWDVMSLDFYDGAGFTTAKYNAVSSYAGSKPIAIGECEQLPTPSQLAAQPKWIYFMGWAELIQENDTNAQIQATYWAPDVLTTNGNNKMPGW